MGITGNRVSGSLSAHPNRPPQIIVYQTFWEIVTRTVTERGFGASFEREGRATCGWTAVPSWRARSYHLLGARPCRVK